MQGPRLALQGIKLALTEPKLPLPKRKLGLLGRNLPLPRGRLAVHGRAPRMLGGNPAMQTHRPGPLCMKSEPRPWNLAKQCSSEPVRATVEALQPACRENMSFTLMISPFPQVPQVCYR